MVWSAKYSSFGKAKVDISYTVTNNLRLPGQYFDQETGLQYNWNRYYNSHIGRYIKSDLLRLAGGINVYSYAYNNPLIHSDVLGLWVLCTPWIPTPEIVWIETKNKSEEMSEVLPSWTMLSIIETMLEKAPQITTYMRLIEYFYYQEEKKLRRYLRACISEGFCGMEYWEEEIWRDTGKRHWVKKHLGLEWKRWNENDPLPPPPDA